MPFKRLTQRILFRLTHTQERLSKEEVRKGVRLLVAEGACSLSMITVHGGPLLASFALALGASNYEIGLLTTITFLGQSLQVAGLYLVKTFQKRKAIAVICAGTSRLLWLFIIAIPLLFVNQGVTFLLQWLLLSACIGALPGPSWTSLYRDLVPPKILGRLSSKRLVLGTGLGLTLTLLGGYFVDWWKSVSPENYLYAYSILFSIALLLGLSGIFLISKLPEPTMKMGKPLPLLDLIRMPFQDKNYRKLLTFLGIWWFVICMTTPFFIIYMLKRVGLSLFTVTLITTTSQLTSLFFFRIWGRVSDRYSSKAVLSVACPLFLMVLLAWSFVTMPERHLLTIPLLFAIHVLSGMALSGINLATNNIALKLSPYGQAHAYMTAFGLVLAVTGTVAPLVGGLLADIFASRELALTIDWSEPARHLSMYALNFRALDFVFFFGILIGFYAIGHLSGIEEKGEVEEQEIIGNLVDEAIVPLRTMSSVGGAVRHIAFLPFRKFMIKARK